MSRHQTAGLARAARLYNQNGCDRCHQKPAITALYVLKATGRAVCQFCLRPGEQYTGKAHCLADMSDGQADDKRWFAENPGKEWRLRDPFPGELEELAATRRYYSLLTGGEDADGTIAETRRYGAVQFNEDPEGARIFTIQVEPGARLRLPCHPPANGAALFQWLMAHMLPYARKTATGSLAVVKTFTPEAIDAAKHAVIHLADPDIAPRVVADAAAQGQAMRQARKATIQ